MMVTSFITSESADRTMNISVHFSQIIRRLGVNAQLLQIQDIAAHLELMIKQTQRALVMLLTEPKATLSH